MNNDYIDLTVLPSYLGAVLLICVAPGPDQAYLVGTGIAGGRRAVTRGALGVSLGVLVYVTVVAAGLGAVVADHSLVLTVLQVFGGGYLLWLGWATLRGARHADAAVVSPPEPRSWFLRGLVVNLTNPKVLLFFVAFLPQFLGRATSPTLQLLLLGLLFQAVGLTVDLAIGWSAGTFRDKVLSRPRVLRAMTYTSAAVFVVLAAVVGLEAVRALMEA